tara:strand:+ start:392 stop:547 length:156 start_codon:yes stop_codon:yes gene_type:complete
MELKIKFNGEMKIDVDINELMEGTDLASLVEEYIKDNMYEVMNCIIDIEEA